MAESLEGWSGESNFHCECGGNCSSTTAMCLDDRDNSSYNMMIFLRYSILGKYV